MGLIKNGNGNGRMTKRKRTNVRRRSSKAKLYSTVVYGRDQGPFAPRHIAKLKYCMVESAFSAVAGAVDEQQFNLNSAFDPDRTSAGHQPYGYDQLAAIYARYRVFRAAWEIEFAPSNDRVHLIVVPINGIGNLPSTVPQAGELPMAKAKVLSYNGGPPSVFRGNIWLPKLAGVPSVEYKSDDRYSALVSASPAEVMVLFVMLYNPTSGTVTTSFTATLYFWTEFFDPNSVAAS